MRIKYQPEKNTLQQILSQYNINNFTYSLATTGMANTTIFVDSKGLNYVLRVYPINGKTESEILQEIDFINFLNAKSFPTVSFIKNIDGNYLTQITVEEITWNYLLMPRISGDEMDKADWGKDTDQLAEIAKLHGQLNLYGSEYSGNLDKKHPLNVADMGIGKMVLEFLEKYTKSEIKKPEFDKIVSGIISLNYQYTPNLKSGIIHDDIYWSNVLVGEKISIIDFDDMRFGPLISCLSSGIFSCLYYSLIFNEDPDLFKKYLESYLKILPISNSDLSEIYKPIEIAIDLHILDEILWHKKNTENLEKLLDLKQTNRKMF